MSVTRPNIHSTAPTINAGSTAHTLVTLPFWATYIRIRNPASVGLLYYDLQGGTPSTADSPTIASSEVLEINGGGLLFKEISLHATTTAAGGQKVYVTAMVGTGETGGL